MREKGEIVVTVSADEKDFWRVLLWYQRKRMLIIILIPTIILVALSIFVLTRVPSVSALPLLLTTVTMPFFFVIVFFLSIKKQAKKLEKISYPTTLTFGGDGIRTVSDSSETFVRWNRYDKVVETSEDFVIFPQENVFYSVPKRFFEEVSSVNHLRALLRENLGDRAKVQK